MVAGYIEPHARPDTQAMIEGLEVIPPLMVDYKGIQLREFNLDAALQRKPQLLLVDELAHTNVHGSRNEKRYQDVQELLRAGINVYTTVNIQHLESLNDLVGNITNIEVRERIPDSVFDQADQVEVIDIEPEELIDRMKEGKYMDQSRRNGRFRIFSAEKNWRHCEKSHFAEVQTGSIELQKKNEMYWEIWSIIQESIYWHVFPLRHPAPR